MKSFPSQLPTSKCALIALASLLTGGLASNVRGGAAGEEALDLTATEIPLLSPEQVEILGHMSIVYLDDGQGGSAKTIRFTGTNVQIVNGTGTTDGPTTGKGNLIVGYNERRPLSQDNRTGSHNIAVGKEHNFPSFGGLVVGLTNSISGDWSSVTGGKVNVSIGRYSSVSGGRFNTAYGPSSSVSGGQLNNGSGRGSSVTGGGSNLAVGYLSSISGGSLNLCNDDYASVSGGLRNTASGNYSSVSGGASRSAAADKNWAAGSLFEAE